MDPRTAENRRTYDEIAPLYDGRQPDELYPVAVEPFDRLCAALSPGSTVADLGCGPGRQFGPLRARGFRVLGVDLSAGMLARAALRAPGRLVIGDLRRLPLRSGSLDGAWSSYALLHLDDHDLELALAELARVLRPGAPAALLLASGSGPSHEPVPYAPEHARWFHRRSLHRVRELAVRAGLEVLWSDVVLECWRSPARLLVRAPA